VPTLAIFTIDGLPAHPLVVHAVVALLPLAALGGLIISLRSSWRRRFGIVVLVFTAAGVAAVPIATRTGEELKGVLPPNNQLIAEHEQLGDSLLPYALAFGIAVVLLLIAGRLADRERDAGQAPTEGGEVAAAPRVWRRVALVAAALVAFTGVVTTVQVVRVGHSGATAVWDGVGSS
jgi:hypothetical protein